MQRRRAAAFTGAVAASLVLAGSAAAFDCIRVSSSLQGLEQSTRSGNWLLFDFGSVQGLQRTLASIEEPVPTDEQAACFVAAYGDSGQPRFFALGIGVAGPHGVIAGANTTDAMGDGHGIDHLEDSGIPSAVEAAAASCGVELQDH